MIRKKLTPMNRLQHKTDSPIIKERPNKRFILLAQSVTEIEIPAAIR